MRSEPELKRGQASHFLHLDNEVLGFDRSGVTVDVDDFEMTARAALRTGEVEELAAAVAAYGGELLPEDRYADWAAERRAEVTDLSARLLLELAAALVRKGVVREATDYLRQALQAEPTQEEIARRLIRLLVRSGNRHEALRQYRRTTEALQRELGVEPEPETVALHAELLAGQHQTHVRILTGGSSAPGRRPGRAAATYPVRICRTRAGGPPGRRAPPKRRCSAAAAWC